VLADVDGTLVTEEKLLTKRAQGGRGQGSVTDRLSRRMDLPPEGIATVRDRPNDLLMFECLGFNIAMGNAPMRVKGQAGAIRDS
jgi:hydroxymethylpyrimidine pyrophosphatase-like HAD family hydrolase